MIGSSTLLSRYPRVPAVCYNAERRRLEGKADENRTSFVLVHHPELARQTACQLSRHRRPDRSDKRCAQELTLARRVRSRRRFEFWTEVSRLIESGAIRPALREAVLAEWIADLAGSFAAVAHRGNMRRLAFLLSLCARTRTEWSKQI